MRRRKTLSWMGKLSLGIILVYVIIALIVPYLPISNPLYNRAPPQDIFVPQILDNISLPGNIVNARAAGGVLYYIGSNYTFNAFNIQNHNYLFSIPLEKENYSKIQLLHYSVYTSIFFYSHNTLYFYDRMNVKLVNYKMDIKKVFPIEQPFVPFTGVAVYNGTDLNFYSLYPQEGLKWSLKVPIEPIGIHTSYKQIYISFPKALWCLDYIGEIKWKVNDTFTSNPIFLRSYEGSYLYVASGDKIERRDLSNGSLTANFSMGIQISYLGYYGQSLFAYSPQGIFGKVNLLNGSFAWKIHDVKTYTLDPFVDGLPVIFKDGRIGFVLLSTGEVQWGYRFNAQDIFMDAITYTTRNVVAYHDNHVLIFSNSGKLITPLPPSNKYPLGTDNAGRDILSQLLWSFRTEIYIALVSTSVVMIVGTAIGILSGYYSGPVDDTLRLITDAFLLIPAIGYAALMIFILGITQHINATLLASLFAVWPIEARAVRNYTKVVKEKPYIEAARVSGASNTRIMLFHILPEVSIVSTVYGLSGAAMALLLEVGVSFLGFGNYMVLTWGWMIANAYFVGIWDKWWVLLPPLLTLMTLVMAIYLLSKDVHEQVLPEDTTML